MLAIGDGRAVVGLIADAVEITIAAKDRQGIDVPEVPDGAVPSGICWSSGALASLVGRGRAAQLREGALYATRACIRAGALHAVGCSDGPLGVMTNQAAAAAVDTGGDAAVAGRVGISDSAVGVIADQAAAVAFAGVEHSVAEEVARNAVAGRVGVGDVAGVPAD